MSDIIKRIENEMNNVPFGSSAFQIKHFIINHNNDARNSRTILLQMEQKLKALKEAEFNKERTEIDLEEIEFKLSNNNINSFEKRRLEIDKKEKEWSLDKQNKYIKDAVIELEVYYSEYEKLPKLSREQFEQEEASYWGNRFITNANRELLAYGRVEPGTLEALNNIGIEVKKNAKNEHFYIGNIPKNLLLEQKSKEG